jgi:hypothetical protein
MANAFRRAAEAARFFGLGAGLASTTALPPHAGEPTGEDDDEAKRVKKADEDVAAAEEDLKKARTRLKKAEDDGDADEEAAAKEEVKRCEEKLKKAKTARRKAKRAEDDDDDAGARREENDGEGDGDDEEQNEDEEDEDERDDAKHAAAIADPAARQRAVLGVLARAKARKFAKGRHAERNRCAAIFAHPNAAKQPDFAGNLAFNTRLTKAEALVLMESAPAAATGRLGERMASVPQPRLGPGGAPETGSAQAIGASWDRAFAKVKSTTVV